ncbi:10381_t:CDS:2 [Racocetra fulgida]|uniref:10381_t:CDS:1 n=1 Tax=Racocetra fulgida TaxID=60492 RepID=A0A9N9IF46_9GLOM|nr:10381_t:CDS:2 [Racocetra fulgida]
MSVASLPFDEDEMSVVSSLFVKDIENLLVEDNQISIKDLLHLEEEKIETYQQFSDKDFIQTAIEVELVKNEIITQPLTRKEQLDILHNALRIVNEKIDNSK